jgi:hypothetical protein
MAQLRNHSPEKNKPRTTKQRTDQIRLLNDRLRQTLSGGHVVITSGVLELGPQAVDEILTAVRRYSDFNPDNDPYGEHDFGAFSHNGDKLFWKMEYHDPELEFGSADPCDPRLTTRVLTVLLASEY